MIDIRCIKCHRLLMRAFVFNGEIKCPKCGYLNRTSKAEVVDQKWENKLKEIYSE